MAGARIPLTPAVHQMIDIGPVERFADARSLVDYPIVRDMDTNMYERQDGGGLEIGSYAHRPIMIDADEIPSIEESALSPTELPFTQQDFELQMEQALELMPEIVGDESVGVRYAINGLLSVTLDGMPLIGETPEVAGLWSAAAIWIKEGPGSGKSVAELMVHGESEIDVYESNIARAYPHQKTRTHIQARVGEGFNDVRDRPSRRAVGVGPAGQAASGLRARAGAPRRLLRGGRLGAPHWYESNAPLLEEFGDRLTRREAEWDARWWSPIINAEHLALRDRAGYIDLSAFAIFDVTGPGALDTVQRVAMRQMDVPARPGRLHADPDARRAVQGRPDDHADRRRRVPRGHRRRLGDVGPEVVQGSPARRRLGAGSRPDQRLDTLGLWGPRARDILSSVTSDDVSHEGFPFARWKSIEIGPLEVIASRISYVGDLGWELYVPIEQGARLWDIIAEAGVPHGAVPVGAGVYGTTGRLEKGYRAYGAELEGEYDVVEAGMAWGKVKDQDFIGKEAHVRQREEPAAHMCTLTVDDHTSGRGQALHARRRADPHPDGHRSPTPRAAAPTSPAPGRSLDRQAHPDELPARRARQGGRAAPGPVHGRVLPGDHRRGRIHPDLRPRQLTGARREDSRSASSASRSPAAGSPSPRTSRLSRPVTSGSRLALTRSARPRRPSGWSSNTVASPRRC